MQCDMTREVSRPVELGYETTASGPTTNFVGNHMTQAKASMSSGILAICSLGLIHSEHHLDAFSYVFVAKLDLQKHRMQGAIDLVQMELEEDNPAASYERLKTYCKMFRPPQRLLAPGPSTLAGSQDSQSCQAVISAPAATLIR